jgi:hypothetical protein
MKRLLRPWVALLSCAAFVVGPTSGAALAAEAGSFVFSVDTGTVNVRTGLITLSGTYSCTVPLGSVPADSETVILVSGANGYEAYLYVTVVVCDGQTRTWSDSNVFSGVTPGKAAYAADGYQAWTYADGSYAQADVHVSGTVRIAATH